MMSALLNGCKVIHASKLEENMSRSELYTRNTSSSRVNVLLKVTYTKCK